MGLKGKVKCQNNYEKEIEEILKTVKINQPEIDRLIIPWQEKISNLCMFRTPWLFWILFGQLIFLIQYLLVTFVNGTTRGLPAFGIYCVIISYGGYLPILHSKRLELMLPAITNFLKLNPDKIRKWFISELYKIFSFKRNVIVFLLLGIPMIISLIYLTKYFQYKEPWFGNELSNIYGIFAFTIWCFIIVYHASFVLSVILFINKLSKLPIKVSIYQHPFISIKAIGKLMFFIATHFIVGASLVYLGIWFSPLPITWLTIIWMILAGIFILAIFLLPQIKIHRLMMTVKCNKLMRFSEHLESTIEKAIEDPSNEIIERLEKLYLVYEHLNGMSNWPFDTKLFIKLITAILIPIIIALIEIIFL